MLHEPAVVEVKIERTGSIMLLDDVDLHLFEGRPILSDTIKTPYGVYEYAKTYRGKVGGRSFFDYVHRELMGFPRGMVVDHRNGDTLDNRRVANLRVVTYAENRYNSKNNRKKDVTGVRRVVREGKYVYYEASLNGIHLGTFKDLDQAIACRRNAEQDQYGYTPYTESKNAA